MAYTKQLTPERTAAVLNYLRNGHYIEQACRLAKIPRRTYSYWLETARKHAAEGKESDYTAFAEQVAEAEAALEARELARIEAAAENQKTWTAAAWLLERRFPQRWSLRNRVEVSGANGEPVQVVVKFAAKKAGNEASDADPA